MQHFIESFGDNLTETVMAFINHHNLPDKFWFNHSTVTARVYPRNGPNDIASSQGKDGMQLWLATDRLCRLTRFCLPNINQDVLHVFVYLGKNRYIRIPKPPSVIEDTLFYH